MTIRSAIEAELPALQAEAESLMVDTCTIKYHNGEMTQNEDTGTQEPVFVQRFTSPCKIQARALVANEAEVGGHTATTVRLELHLPVSCGQVNADDVAEVTAVGGSSDLQLVGRRFRVVGPVGKTFQTARRFEVEEVVR